MDYSVRWSSTESGGVGLAALIDDDHLDAVGSIGHPRDGVAARIAGDGGGDPVADGQVGELQIRSDAMMECYLGSPEATAEAMTADGWLRTGDLARRRADGRFVLAGRESDMYIRGGYNVYPEEVEAVLGAHPDLAAVAVAARPDEVMGEIGVAVVVIRPGHDAPTLDELRDFAADRVARHKLPEDLLVAEEVPLTAAAKIDRRRLEKLVAPCSP